MVFYISISFFHFLFVFVFFIVSIFVSKTTIIIAEAKIVPLLGHCDPDTIGAFKQLAGKRTNPHLQINFKQFQGGRLMVDRFIASLLTLARDIGSQATGFKS